MAEVVKVTTKGQVTLPAWIRRDLKIEDNSYLIAEEVGDFVVLRRLESRFLEIADSFRREVRRKKLTQETLLRALKATRQRRRR